LACAITLQAALGVVTLLHQAPLALALAHQAMAIVVLTIAVVHVEHLERRAESVNLSEDKSDRKGGSVIRGGEAST
jgi:cytochrome c oxidase assembly protein subunit 15